MVFTNGVFDILHRGHVEYLARAAALGPLWVGINSDRSVRLLKGQERPVNRDIDRAAVLSALRSVERVFIFDELTPLRLIQELRPEVYVKGGDYDMDTLPEAALVRSWGGKALAMPFLQGYSTTGILRRL